jgi:glyoxalase family protein
MTHITGIHHLTSGVGGAQEDIDFFTKVIGQRLVKQTVLFDGWKPIYHLYYANRKAQPGTIMTTLPFKQVGYQGYRGSGQINTVSYSVPAGSLEFWFKHFERYGVETNPISERFGRRLLWFAHPCGLEFELVEDPDDKTEGWRTDEISEDVAVRGFHSIVWSVRDTEETERFMTEGLGFEKAGVDGAYTRFQINGGGSQRFIDLRHDPNRKQGTWGFAPGVVHHMAFAVPTEKEQAEVKNHLNGMGFPDVSEVKDRNYFHSVYVRSPGGVLVEIATTDIGFTIDESTEELGEKLMIPPWWEYRRNELIAALEPIQVPKQAQDTIA